MKITVVVLAAGAGSRFKGIKQLARINKQPMILHSLNVFEQAEIGELYVAIGAHAEKIRPLIPSHIRVVEVEQWQKGLSQSIKTAVKFLASDCTHLFISLADQVAVTVDEIKRLAQLAARSPNNIVAAQYAATIGVPAIFPRQYFTELLSLDGDKGAGNLIQQYKHNAICVSLDHAAFDIDTADDLTDWQELE
jgi:molybdenum cofactor cytidylyltransferase